MALFAISKAFESLYSYAAPARPSEPETGAAGGAGGSYTAAERQADLEYGAAAVQAQVETDTLRGAVWKGIHPVHTIAMKNEFLVGLIKGQMCSKAYVGYLCNVFWLQRALETAQDKILAKYKRCGFVFPELYRSEKLLADIQLWSIFNGTATQFADLDRNSPEFLANVERFVQPCVSDFIRHLEDLATEDPMFAIGAMYALYGTVMSGGQHFKGGVEKAFKSRITEDPDEELTETALLAQVRADPEHFIPLSISFFSLPPGIEVSVFKKETWYQAFNQIPSSRKFEGEAKRTFEERIIQESTAAIQVVLDLIVSLHDALRERRL